jgi:hypothetical protein
MLFNAETSYLKRAKKINAIPWKIVLSFLGKSVVIHRITEEGLEVFRFFISIFLLHDEHSIITLTSFQVNREVRLILTHRSHRATERYLL